MTKRVALHDFAFGRFEARHRIEPSRWPHFDLFWMHKGRVRLRFTTKREELLRQGEGVLIYPDTDFGGVSVSPVSRVSVHHFAIAPDGDPLDLPLPLRRLLGRRHGYERYRPRGTGEVQAALARSVRWAACRQTPMITELRVAQFIAILAQLTLGSWQGRPTDVASAAFERLIEELRSTLDHPMSLHDMAARVGMSTSHFRARFHELYRASPGLYLLRLRMMEAARLLSQTTLPVKTIARQTGYSQVTAFYRMFRGKIGVTPAEYRRRYGRR